MWEVGSDCSGEGADVTQLVKERAERTGSGMKDEEREDTWMIKRKTKEGEC